MVIKNIHGCESDVDCSVFKAPKISKRINIRLYNHVRTVYNDNVMYINFVTFNIIFRFLLDDHTRVVLQSSKDGDYIHANFIKVSIKNITKTNLF